MQSSQQRDLKKTHYISKIKSAGRTCVLVGPCVWGVGDLDGRVDTGVGAAVDMVGLVGAVGLGVVDRLVGSSMVGGLVGGVSRSSVGVVCLVGTMGRGVVVRLVGDVAWSSVGMVGLVGAMGRGMMVRLVGLYMVILLVVGQVGGGGAGLVGPWVGGEPG